MDNSESTCIEEVKKIFFYKDVRAINQHSRRYKLCLKKEILYLSVLKKSENTSKKKEKFWIPKRLFVEKKYSFLQKTEMDVLSSRPWVFRLEISCS